MPTFKVNIAIPVAAKGGISVVAIDAPATNWTSFFYTKISSAFKPLTIATKNVIF